MEESKSELIRQYIVKNNLYTIPSRQLAKLVLRDNSNVFGEYSDLNIDRVRTLVRNIRWSSGENKSEINTLFAEKFHGFLEPDVNDYSPFFIPDSVTSLGVICDVHVPYFHPKNFYAALDWLEAHGIDGLLLNGDFLDCYKVSSFVKDRRKRSTADEFKVAREMLDMIAARFKCQIFYKLGNHESRIENMVLKEVPELLEFINFESCLEDGGKFPLSDYNITIIKDKRIIKFTNNLSILHGDEYGNGFTNPVGVARWLYLKAKSNALCGHLHKSDEFSARDVNGKIIKTWSVGCLCEMNPQYRPLNDWQAGFARVTRNGEFYKVTNLTIDNGIIY